LKARAMLYESAISSEGLMEGRRSASVSRVERCRVYSGELRSFIVFLFLGG
jgi:hypothetical protein